VKYFSLTFVFLVAAASVVFFVLRNPPKQESAPKQQPRDWNTNAIRGIFAGVQVKEIDPTHAQLIFSYDLENATDSEYRLTVGPEVALMEQLKSDGSLRSQDSIRIDSPVFLPAKSRGRVSLQVARPFNWPSQIAAGQVGPFTQEKFRSFVAKEVSNVQEFILFDEASRYKIELPGGWQDSAAPASKAAIN
jgi:hypothetical protein